MGKHVAAVCACLHGQLCLQLHGDYNQPSDNTLPVPWICVNFRDETVDSSAHDSENAHPNVNTRPDNDIKAGRSAGIDGRSLSKTLNQCNDEDYLRVTRDKLVALRFLSLVARCPEYSWRGNPSFWYHVLINICGAFDRSEFFPRDCTRQGEKSSCAPARSTDEMFVMPIFKLAVEGIAISRKFVDLCEQALLANPEDEVFGSVGQRVKNLLHRFGICIPWQPRSVAMSVCFKGCRIVENVSMCGLRAILTAASNNKMAGPCLSCIRFTITSLTIDGTELSEQDLTTLSQTVAISTLALRELKLYGVFAAVPKQCPPAFGALMGSCFAVPDPSDISAETTTPLTRLSLNSNWFGTSQYISLFSAIHESNGGLRGVRELSLQQFGDTISWLWLAFGIFHHSSKSQVTDLHIYDCVLRQDDIDVVRQLLDAADVAPLLTQKNMLQAPRRPPRALGHDSSHQWVLLPSGTCLEAPREPKNRRKGTSTIVLTLEAERWCEALQKGKKWTCVLVPAFGKLWVKSSIILKTMSCSEYNSEAGVQRNTCKLETLKMSSVKTVSQVLRVSDEDGHIHGQGGGQPVHEVLSKWISIVGRSLRSLHLSYNPLTTSALTVILESCPRLQNLNIEGCELTSISPITDAYTRGICQLQALKAAHNSITTESQSGLFRALSDCECDAARHLLVLDLEGNPTDVDNAVLTLFLSVMRTNKTVTEVIISMNTKHENALSIRHVFEKHHEGEWLRYEDLSSKKRLALLSIPAMKTLPSVVFGIILEFAKTSIFRRFYWGE